MLGDLLHHPPTPLRWGVVVCASLVAMAHRRPQPADPQPADAPAARGGTGGGGGVRGGGAGWPTLRSGVCCWACPYVALFLFAGGGGGDAKLMGAIGAWVGFASGVIVLLGRHASAARSSDWLTPRRAAG